MTETENGFSTPLAMTVLFSLCIMTAATGMYAAACERRINSYNNILHAEAEAMEILHDIEISIQSLKEESSDSLMNKTAEDLALKYKRYGLTMKDVSTGIHKNFLCKDFYENKNIQEYISSQDESVFTEYGWMHPKHTDRKILETAADDFDTADLFPIVNDIPLYNIYSMTESFLKAVLGYAGIKQPAEQARKIIQALGENPEQKEIVKMIGVSQTHPVFDFLGTKTAFWKIRFETGRCTVQAVFAAVPRKNNQNEIKKYILVEKSISYKGGA